MNAALGSAPISEQLLTRFDVAGPRYTSYPTADRFVEAFSADDYSQALLQRRSGAAALALPLSLYVHIPFCESLCYYCACNKIITKHHDKAATYLRYLTREVELHTRLMGTGQSVSQLHLGGGSPTFLSDTELRELMAMLRRNFSFVAGGEYSIEVDPRTVDAARLDTLAELGFNRLSFGVQDFDPAVQKAVHRVQPAEQVFALVEAARARGFESINVDLIYGLPRQSPESFDRTLAQVNALRPDRIALYAYAHLPERFKPQRRIATVELPGAASKVSMLAHSLASFMGAGYVYVGMDHFALPDDSLAVAKRQGRLHRNFQGYTTQPDADLIGLGVSAISKVGSVMVQNTRELDAYEDALSRGHLALFRGHELTRDDIIRYSVIMGLLCQGSVQFQDYSQSHWIEFESYFEKELAQLRQFSEQGLLDMDEQGIEVTPLGWFFARPIAMVFDHYFHQRPSGHSKVL